MQELHIIDKNEKLLFTCAEDRIKDSPDCKIVDKMGMKKIVLQLVNYESKMEEKLVPMQTVKKRNMMEKTEDLIQS